MYSQTFYPFHMWFHNMRRYAMLLPMMATVFGACAGDDIVGPVDLSRTKIAFTSLRDNLYGIYIINVDGAGETRLANGLDPSWSPDGRQIVYSRGENLNIINADGSDDRDLHFHFQDLTREIKNPAWSPNGETIICEGRTAGGGSDIFAFKVADIDELDGDIRDWVNLTNSPAQEHSPAWSPDGSEIVYARDDGTNRAIYTMYPDGANQSLLLSGTNALDLAWSPDKRMLGYLTGVFGDIEVWRADWSHPQKQVLITQQSYPSERWVKSGPSWSPNGRQFVYAVSDYVYSDYPTRLMIYDFSRGILEQQQLTGGDYPDVAPDWSPVEVTP